MMFTIDSNNTRNLFHQVFDGVVVLLLGSPPRLLLQSLVLSPVTKSTMTLNTALMDARRIA